MKIADLAYNTGSASNRRWRCLQNSIGERMIFHYGSMLFRWDLASGKILYMRKTVRGAVERKGMNTIFDELGLLWVYDEKGILTRRED